MTWLRALAVLPLFIPALASATCPPAGSTRESLAALKAKQFAVPDAAERAALVKGLLGCLGAPDPALRDGIAYEALTRWLRDGALDTAALRGLRDALQGLLAGADAEGFRKPFAALVLSEVARVDRVKPWMTAEERTAMVEAAARYVESVRDYRGFDAATGWRHGVAHGSDWLMQLSLNPALERAQADRILAAVATQAVPERAHAYVFGEPERLARPVLFLARRGLYSEEEWRAWLAALLPRLGDASKAYKDAAWLARRHDLRAFLLSLLVGADEQLASALRATLKQVP
ncbi:DUF2785 domain-containing protein [Corallococcus macrosporus]|uniref:DUF2785 domain-containing protein n=1 Tax=Myxococcus fulvus (strain ATCC BAA-855 / HW-1) TaxID=483219 RepID=F8CE60_MYXFH|nr:DUF2785 domain-containing protein [Corallococcus macrosporus]AEI63521.1 hypothetical protein LILAB_08040 [Corallococcus macrosporus]